jgi:hypothetical protein
MVYMRRDEEKLTMNRVVSETESRQDRSTGRRSPRSKRRHDKDTDCNIALAYMALESNRMHSRFNTTQLAQDLSGGIVTY